MKRRLLGFFLLRFFSPIVAPHPVLIPEFLDEQVNLVIGGFDHHAHVHHYVKRGHANYREPPLVLHLRIVHIRGEYEKVIGGCYDTALIKDLELVEQGQLKRLHQHVVDYQKDAVEDHQLDLEKGLPGKDHDYDRKEEASAHIEHVVE